MKGCRFYAFLIVVTTFLLLTSAWAETVNQEQSKEIFIGQFKGGISVKWCGNNALVVSGREIGMEWIDFLSSNAVKIRPSGYGYDYPYNCTSDGKWLVYVDRKSSRTDKGYKPTKDMNDVDWDGWDGGVVDLYRYDIATGKSQRFAVVRYVGPFEVVSPDGKKIFLGSRHNSAIEMPEPKWDAVWFKNNWGQNGAKWFLDSSGVITRQHNPNRIGVEFFSKNGWAKMFNTQFGDNIVLPDDFGTTNLNLKLVLPCFQVYNN